MINVKLFNSRIEAEIAKSLLDNNGIMAWINADDQGGMRPALAFTQGVVIYVLEEDQKKAEEVLKALI